MDAAAAMLLAATLYLWDLPCGEPIDHFRVRQIHKYQIGIELGHDDLGNPVAMPIYSPWLPVLVQESMETMALVTCEPEAGACCFIEVSAVDVAGNLDEGVECS